MRRRMILLTAVLALVAAACGGGEDGESGVASLSTVDDGGNGSAAGVTGDGAVDPEQAMLDLTQCLRDQGIEIADPTVDAEGNPQLARPEFDEGGANEAFRTAIRECGELLEGVTLGRQGLDFSALQDTLVEYAGCMRDNGYQMDDPDFSSFGRPPQDGEPGQGGGRVFGQFDLDDPEWQAANEACEDILAGFGPGGPGGRFGGDRPGGG